MSLNMEKMKTEIDSIYQDINGGKKIDELNSTEKDLILSTIDLLDKGTLRVSEKINNHWLTHEAFKKAILLYFRIQKMQIVHSGDLQTF